MLEKSRKALRKARTVIPGGVNSPVRAFRGVGGTPPFIRRGAGSKLYDIDGNRYIDYVGSWGPLILGHADRDVVRAIHGAARNGSSFGAPTLAEVELASLITRAYPSIQKVRLVNSGTEAVMSAIRLARGYTKRPRVIKFEGCYHGHSDFLLAKAGSGAMTFGLPDSAGVPAEFTSATAVLPYNDLEPVRDFCSKRGEETAAMIVEPVAGNMGVVLPKPGFLAGLREVCDRYGIVLIFDEVITGFRVAFGGVQQLCGIRPDMTTLGKIIGGGMPIGAYGGRDEIMDLLAPLGPVYQAGTLSGNPVAVAAGLATLRKLEAHGFYEELERKSAKLAAGLSAVASDAGVPVTLNRVGSMMTAFFTAGPVTDYTTAKQSDTKLYARFFHRMLASGIYLAPSQFEAMFVSAAHTDVDIERTISAATRAFGHLRHRGRVR